MNGTVQQFDDSGAGLACTPRWTLPAWRPDERAGSKPEGDWLDLPTGFLSALRTAAPFASRDPSVPGRMGVLLEGEHAYATDNRVLVEVEVGGAVPHGMVPLWLARLLMKRSECPHHILVLSDSIAFAWEDGTWVSAASPGCFSATVIAAFDGWRECAWQIPPDWKKAFATVARLADETIVIRPDRISGGHGQTEAEAEIITPVDQDTIWSRPVLMPVIRLAERIDFSTWPESVPFAFANGRGFVVGRR